MTGRIGFTDEEFTVQAPMGPRTIRLRTPQLLAPHPALLIVLGNDRMSMLDHKDYRTPGDILLAAGHRVAAFDMPYHGDRKDKYGEGLVGMAAAMAAGVDVFGDIRDTGKALIDYAIDKGLTRAGEVAVCGVSRGGISVLHIMAGDDRVGVAATHATVSHLPALREFAPLADNEMVKRSNADALVDKLADRWVFLAMGETDPRVDARSTFAFYARLRARSVSRFPTLYTSPGESHGLTYVQHIGYQMSAAFMLEKLGECGKMSSRKV